MPLISESDHQKTLKRKGINIKTRYGADTKYYERNTDGSKNDDIVKGVRCGKLYYLNGELKHTENIFDSRILYTYVSKEQENKEFKCPNCGMESILKNFEDGCPYCRTKYNLDYTNKDLGSKFTYDLVLKSNKYRIITAIVDLIISIILSFIFIKVTSRTFNNIDIIKIFVYGVILAMVLYYIFYIVDAYIVLGPIKMYKDRQNKKQIEFWRRTGIDKAKFYNNFNYEISKYYYEKENVIDYDILDYLSFNEYKKNDKYYVDVKIDIRVIYLSNNKFVSKYMEDTFTMYKNELGILELKNGINYIKCRNCGNSIDVTNGECSFCHTTIKYLQEWILEKKD